MLSALRAPSAWCRRSLSKRKSAKERQEVSAFARPSPSPSSSCSASPGPHADGEWLLDTPATYLPHRKCIGYARSLFPPP